MDAVTEVKARLSIEDVVSEYVQLKRSGRNLKGLSPFSNEKTASFMVSPEKQIWHDFSSGKGGDMFTFIQEVEGLDFKATLELLARKAGIDLEQFRGKTGGGKHKERLYEVIELSTKFYQVQLKNSRATLEYLLKKREFKKETVTRFRLGYSPNTGDALYKFLKSKGFKEDEIKEAGLITKRYKGPSDMFRGRVMVPLSDAQGRPVGFTARQLEDEPDSPKYINTPSTLLYDKGRQVYGLHLAKESIRKEGFAVVVEGNLDVIASHQAGVSNVVAAAGTALTEQHLKSLGRFAADVRFAFDSDRAGIAATERAIPLAQNVGVNVSIIDIPDGKDPDDLVRKDPKLWLAAINNHKYAVDWLIERYKNLLDIKTGQGKRKFTDVVLAIIKNLQDAVEQDHYAGELAKITEVSKEAVVSKLRSSTIKTSSRLKKVSSPQIDSKELVEKRKVEQRLLAVLLMYPSLRPQAHLITNEMFNQPEASQLFEFIITHLDFKGDLKTAKGLHSISDYVKIVILHFEELYRSLESIELHNEVARLQERLVAIYVKEQKQKIHSQLLDKKVDDRKLLELDKALNDLLNEAKGV